MFQLPQKLTLYFYIPISRQSLCQAAVDTFRVYELDFSFVLGSLKQTPEQMESYYVNFITLFVTMNLCQPCCFFCLYTLQLHFKTPLEFYAWITTLSEQQHSQTLTNRFFAFSMLICSWASSHTENYSCKWPAPEMETFFMLQGCPHRVSTVVIVMATNKEKKQQGTRRSEQ